MKLQNLNELMISASDVKKELPEIMSNQITKLIVKNNVPVSVIMPYSDYLTMAVNDNEEEIISKMIMMGQGFTMNNGVEVLVTAGIGGTFSKDDLVIKVFHKMKNSDDLKLFHTFNIGSPSIELTMTTDEIRECYQEKN